jgi:hypothetical protein
MNLIFRRMAWRLFKIPTVALINYNGELTLAFAWQATHGGWCAYRYRAIQRIIHLQPFGACHGACYVIGWQPLVGAFGSGLMRHGVKFHEQEAA